MRTKTSDENSTLKTLIPSPVGVSTMKGPRTELPTLLHALPESPTISNLMHFLDTRSCVVVNTRSSDDLRFQFSRKRPTAVLLPASLGGESAWLLTAKLRLCDRSARVVVLCENATTQEISMGRFVGASAVLPANADPITISNQLFGPSFGFSDN